MESNIGNKHPDRLDDIDLHIINALRADGRVAFAQLAEQLNVSPGMIRQRYNRLVDLGYLKVVAVTNPLMMGKRTMSMIGIRTDGRKMMDVASKIAKFDEVVYIVATSGRYDLMIEVFCSDHEDMLNFMTEKLAKVDGVRETESFIYLKIIKEIYF
ncbi:MAG: Lrp/AsnC family transcriptional regulator [Anaerolineales bacterium]|jgi:Lrp/AsnC family transcriptional regulator for asnA, asnC and gidA|uniref:Lrp/AsnC family transcriptional regulator n=1 Tax=Candidatus Villigracilis vicinus TaxID=3140679 RepID=UPI003134B475|nr:Lrp/AsnC family transcriptional regulator [Anaerolineales bacterium]MBK7448590.1 Lrp/AsnC family transcriptional regulator [Anaerolineales bacterium]MBK9782591.1 Lrp/AsnC family transcriptional regulator [Anaerolineales bacterium]